MIRRGKNRLPSARLSLVVATLVACGLASEASAQAAVAVIADTYLRLDLDGDGFDDVPLPPLGTPAFLPLDETSSVSEFETVASNGLTVTTAIDIDGGDAGIDEPSGPIAGIFGTYVVDAANITLPVGGFASGHSEIVMIVPITLVAGPAGFAASAVDLEIAASIEGTIRYIAPSVSGFTFSTTWIAEDEDEFDVKNGSFTDDGNRFGDAEFLGLGYSYSFDAGTSTATWQMPETSVVLSLTVPVTPGASSAETTLRFKQFNEITSSNFFGTDPVIASGTVEFEYGATGGRLVAINAVQPDVSLEVPVPEPGAVPGLAWGTLCLLGVGRRSARSREAPDA